MIRFVVSLAVFLFAASTIEASSHSTQQKENEIIYEIYTPKLLRPGMEIACTLSVIRSPNPVAISTVFFSKNIEIEFENSTIIVSGSTTRVILGKIPIDYNGSKEFNLTIAGVDMITQRRMFTDSTKDFKFKSKPFSILIQTDKPVYRPGEIIRFRAMCLTPELKPLSGSISIQVKDPKGNIVPCLDCKSNKTLLVGLAGGIFNLSKLALEGNWSIFIEHKGYKQNVTVVVKNYELPKFDVYIESPKYIYPSTEGFTIKLKANYTTAQPVKGKALLTVEIMPLTGRTYPRKMITIHETSFKGEVTHLVTKSQIENELLWHGDADMKIEVIGVVTEALTNETCNETMTLNAKQSHIKVEVLSKPVIIKPNLLYLSLVKVSEQDDSLLVDSERIENKLIVEATYHYSHELSFIAPHLLGSSVVVLHSFNIPPSGLVPVRFMAKQDNFVSVTMKVYTNATSSLLGSYKKEWTVGRAYSPSESYIQVFETLLKDISIGNEVKLSVRMTEPVHELKWMVLARGEILLNSVLSLKESEIMKRKASISFNATKKMAPSCIVLVSYVKENKEVVADYLNLNVALHLNRTVNISKIMVNGTEVNQVEAGANVSIIVETEVPHSRVGLMAMDLNMVALKSKNNITEERIVCDWEEYVEREDMLLPLYSYSYSSGAVDAKEVYKKSGMIVLTNALLYELPRELSSPKITLKSGKILDYTTSSPIPSGMISLLSHLSASPMPRLRALFPETWLWEEATTNSNGTAMFKAKALDSIASWELGAFSLSPEEGLSIALPRKLNVVKKFFMTLDMPLKVKRNEVIILEANIYNNFEEDLHVQVSLEMNHHMELLNHKTKQLTGPFVGLRRIVVPSGGRITVKYPLRMSTLGDIPIKIHAKSHLASDEVLKHVFVKPEGIEQCYSTSVVIDKPMESVSENINSLQIKIPQRIVPGSEKVSLHTYGNMLGSTISNLGKLLKTPTGCGEQNMMNFAPDVFVALYLQYVEQLDEKTKNLTLQHVIEGYQNQLRYKHDDGSFSAFGKRDKSGSTFLTAFVCKCLMFAELLEPTLVEDRIIEEGLKFLMTQQNADGSFKEPGQIIHKELQGGVNNAMSMTAYILVTLIERPISKKTQELLEVENNALLYLESHLDSVKYDPYTLSLVTYALSLYGSRSYQEALRSLNNLATTDERGLKYWHKDSEEASSYKSEYLPPYRVVPSHDMEMTAYALMTTVRMGDLDSAKPIMKWMISKQNELGGFLTTQDTVIAVEALSMMASAIRELNQNLVLSMAHTGDKQFEETYAITTENQMEYHTIPVTPVNGELTIVSRGTGLGVAHMSVCYNILSKPYEEEPFDCTIHTNSTTNNTDTAVLGFWCSQKENVRSSSGMLLLEMELLTGFSIDLYKVKLENNLAKLVELRGNKLYFYFDQLRPNQTVCGNITMKRYAGVTETKPAKLVATEFYKPEKKVIHQYSIDEINEASLCEVCGSDCLGCPAPVLTEWKPWTPCVEFCKPELSTSSRYCYDPSLKKNVDISKCGLQKQPVKSQVCPKLFSCPSVSDGLWYDLPRHIPQSKVDRPCYIATENKMLRSPNDTIPGVILNGLEDHLQCNDSRLLQVLPETGFTISLLVNPRIYKQFAPDTFLSIGEDGKLPIVAFERLWWNNELRLEVNIGNHKYTVKEIPINELPVGQWSHVTLTWNEENGAKVYINGAEVGVKEVIALRVYQPYERDLKFYLGKNTLGTIGSSWKQGYLAGKIAALNYWPIVLPTEEIDALAAFYEEIVEHFEEPLLSTRHLRHFAPSDRKMCFGASSVLSSIFAGVHGKCHTHYQLQPIF